MYNMYYASGLFVTNNIQTLMQSLESPFLHLLHDCQILTILMFVQIGDLRL